MDLVESERLLLADRRRSSRSGCGAGTDGRRSGCGSINSYTGGRDGINDCPLEAGGDGGVFDPAILVHGCVRGGDGVYDACEGRLELFVEDDWLLDGVERFRNHGEGRVVHGMSAGRGWCAGAGAGGAG